jgi:GH24 family phage-related lysozyme (muramidase)
MINQAGIDLIKRFEGYSEVPYLDQLGIRTIGYGHVIEPGENFTRLSQTLGDSLLISDVKRVERIIDEHVTVELTDNQRAGLASFVYNVGAGQPNEKDGFVHLKDGRPSTMLALLNDGQVLEAAGEFERWIYIGGKPSEAMKVRRAAERGLFLTPSLVANANS